VNLQQDVGDSTTPLFDMDGKNNEDEADKEYQSTLQMLSEFTQEGYERMHSEMIEEFGIPKEQLCSFYVLTQNRPKIEKFIV